LNEANLDEASKDKFVSDLIFQVIRQKTSKILICVWFLL